MLLSELKDINGEFMSEINADLETQMEISRFANGELSLANISFGAVQLMLRHHVDVFGWVGDELAYSR